MRLLVYWGTDAEADFQMPKLVTWEDGTPATMNDYSSNRLATQTSVATDVGMVTVMFPDVVGVTLFDRAKARWVVLVPDHDVIDLQQTNPDASDETLRWEISCYPIEYRCTIDRSHKSKKTAVGESTVVNSH